MNATEHAHDTFQTGQLVTLHFENGFTANGRLELINGHRVVHGWLVDYQHRYLTEVTR